MGRIWRSSQHPTKQAANPLSLCVGVRNIWIPNEMEELDPSRFFFRFSETAACGSWVRVVRHLCGERLCRIFYFTTSPRARSARRCNLTGRSGLRLRYRRRDTPPCVRPGCRWLHLNAGEDIFQLSGLHDMSYDPARISFASLFWHGVACAGCAHPSRLESKVQSVSDCRYLLLSHVLSKLRTRLDCARGKKNQNGLRKISISLNFIPTHRASKWWVVLLWLHEDTPHRVWNKLRSLPGLVTRSGALDTYLPSTLWRHSAVCSAHAGFLLPWELISLSAASRRWSRWLRSCNCGRLSLFYGHDAALGVWRKSEHIKGIELVWVCLQEIVDFDFWFLSHIIDICCKFQHCWGDWE